MASQCGLVSVMDIIFVQQPWLPRHISCDVMGTVFGIWELNSVFMQNLPVVSPNHYRAWFRDWKSSIAAVSTVDR